MLKTLWKKSDCKTPRLILVPRLEEVSYFKDYSSEMSEVAELNGRMYKKRGGILSREYSCTQAAA